MPAAYTRTRAVMLAVFTMFIYSGAKATAQDAEWLESLECAKRDLSERAASTGIESLDGPYLEVHKAAKECGFEGQYRVSYKTLSKFAHPTAMLILANPDETKRTLQRDWLFSEGCLYFTGAVAGL
jgi:hypothetical protein